MAPTDDASASKSSDTHRRTWDRTEYAAKAATRDAQIKEEGRARYEAKQAGKKYIPRQPSPSSLHDSTSRTSRLDVSANVGKTTLIPSGASTGKRGKSAGFYCSDCDLTFKDNLQFVEHLNSKQHLVNSGESGEVRKAGIEEVRERIAWLVRKREEEQKEENAGDLRARLEMRGEDMEREREEKRRKRREKRRKTEGGVGVKVEEEEGYGGGVIC